MNKDNLGDRMKDNYENRVKTQLLYRISCHYKIRRGSKFMYR